MKFTIIGPIREAEVIARGGRVRVRRRLTRIYGRGNWRKMKGIAEVMYADGRICLVELHWFEAHGIGRKEMKDKHVLREL